MAGRAESTLPFIGVSEGFELMNKVWSAAGLPTPASMVQFATQLPQTLPSMVAPTLDIEELDKRIAGLRAVEQWLNLNLNMLRTTVQSLEVQRNTIATLTSLGGTMLATPTAVARTSTPPAPATNWPYAGGQGSVPMPAPAIPPAAEPAPVPKPAAAKRKRPGPPAPAEAPAALPLNPTAWWNSLQEQFTRIAAAAAAQTPVGAAAKTAKAEATKPKATKKSPAAKKAPERKNVQS
jgi:hypothetical protein